MATALFALACPAAEPVATGDAPPPPPARSSPPRASPPRAERPPLDPRLDPKPTVSEPLGLRFHAPRGSLVTPQRIGAQTTLGLSDARQPPTWSARVQTLRTEGPTTPAAEVDRLLASWTAADRAFTVIADRTTTVADRPARLCYVAPELDGPDGDGVVIGWAVIGRGPQELLVFSSQIRTSALATVRPLLEASFATVRLVDAEAIVVEQEARLLAGRMFLDQLTPERLRALVGTNRWMRHYLPASATDGRQERELGFFNVEFRAGSRGAINPGRDPDRYRTDERAEGLLVVVEGHYLEPDGSTYDSQASYWLAWDRSEEAWSVRGTARAGRRSRSDALTGHRTPRSASDPHGTLTVIRSERDGATRDQQRWRVPEIYMPQPVRWALGRLLADVEAPARSFSTYAFDPSSPALALTMRTDRWEPFADGSGRFRLTSRARGGGPEIATIHAADGRVLRVSWPEGPVSEPMPLADLHELWQRKGLPTGRERGGK